MVSVVYCVLLSRFDVPIAFQQTNRPVPLEYTLNTHFQITNNEQMFVMNPFTEGFDLEDMDSDTHIAFSKGNPILLITRDVNIRLF